MHRPALGTITLLATTTLLAACAGPAPELIVQGAYVAEQREGRRVVNVVIDAKNTSDKTIPLATAAYSSGSFSATREPQFAVGPQTTQRFVLPVVLPASDDQSQVAIRGTVAFLPQNKLRRLLADFLPLPQASLRGEALIGPAPDLQPARTFILPADRIAAPETKPADTLPPQAK